VILSTAHYLVNQFKFDKDNTLIIYIYIERERERALQQKWVLGAAVKGF
jgi:hypothetical protein